MSEVTNIETLLSQAQQILKVHDKKATKEGGDFNLLELVRADIGETSISNYLKCLLDPNGKHAQGRKPLQFLIERLPTAGLRPDLAQMLKRPIQLPAYATCEVGFGDKRTGDDGLYIGGRVDLLFTWPGVALIVENKPYCGDQDRQLGRYYNSMADNRAERILVYLTKDGRPPNMQTLDCCPPDQVVSLSFNQLFKILEEYSATLPANNHYRSSIYQISRFVSQALSYQTSEYMTQEEKLMELFRSGKNYQAATSISEALNGFLFKQFTLWIENIVLELEEAGCQLGKYNEKPYWINEGKNNWWKGEDTFFYFEGWGDIALTIGADHEGMGEAYIGLRGDARDKRISRKRALLLYDSLKETLKASNYKIHNGGPSEYWIFYIYYKNINSKYTNYWEEDFISTQLHTKEFANLTAQPIIKLYNLLNEPIINFNKSLRKSRGITSVAA